MYSLLLLSSLLYITTCIVYTVTPDDHYYPNTTCHHCHNLQHYLLNITKYFTSNTQLLFLPGLHHLCADLIVQDVHNISLIGSTANGTTLDTVIHCNSSAGIVMTNITNLTLKNMVIRGCRKLVEYTVDHVVAVAIENCSDVILSCLHIYMGHNIYLQYSLLGINVLGKFDHISCNAIVLYYNEMQARNTNNTLLIDNFQQVEYINSLSIINLVVYEHSYKIIIQLAHITFQQQPNDFLHGKLSNSILYIMDCQFLSNKFLLFLITDNSDNSSITFINCKFLNNTNVNPLIDTRCVNVTIINCAFNGNAVNIRHSNIFCSSNNTTVVIENTQFNYNILDNAYEDSLIETRYVDVTIVNCSFNGNLNIVL